MKVINRKILNFLFYVIYVFIYLYVVRKYGMGSENSKIRYYFLVFIILFGFISIVIINAKKRVLKKGFKDFRGKNLLLSLIVAILFYIFSYFKAKSVYASLDGRTITQIFLFLLPTIYAFIVINLFSKEEIISMFKITTIALIITYFMEDKHSITQFLRISNWLSIDLIHSNSFTESHLCARSFTILFLFFNYIYWTDKNCNILKYLIITFVFSVLCFKRMDILVAIITFWVGKKFSFKSKTGIKRILISTLIITLLTLAYFNFLRGNIFTNLDVFTLTSGRNRILNLWALQKYYSFGYGTSMLIIGRYLELDLIQIYLEMNIFALILFVFSNLYYTRNNIYSYFIMLYVLFNMMFASSLANILAWILLMIIIAYISNIDRNLDTNEVN